jgi:long-chain fatty acid transport protein
LLLGAAALFAVASSATVAQASGFATARFGSEHGHPTTTNATAIYYNPAGIAESRGTHLYVDGLFAIRRATFEHPRAETDADERAGAEGANTGKASLLNFAAAPMAGVTTRISDFALGLGAYVPFGGATSWDQNDDFDDHPTYPGPVDGVQRWHSINGEIRSMYVTLAAAYQLGASGLSLGVAGNLIHSNIDTIRARTVLGTNNLDSEGRSQLDAAGWQASFALGAMYQAIRDTLWIGASYQARPNVSGGMRLKGTLRNYFAGSPTQADIDIEQDLPDIYRLGVRYRPREDLELRLFGDLTRWSSLERHCIVQRGGECELNADGSAPETSDVIQNLPRDWNDTFGVRAGASYWFVPHIEGFAGLGFDSNAVPDETLEPTFMDANKLSVAAGARLELASNVHLAASYLHVLYLPRDNTNASTLAEVEPPSRSPDAGGEYRQWLGAVNVNVDVAFDGP